MRASEGHGLGVHVVDEHKNTPPAVSGGTRRRRGRTAGPCVAWALILLGIGLAAVPDPVAGADVVELAVVVNARGPVRQVDLQQLYALFTSARRNWPDGTPALAFNLPPGVPLRTSFDLAVLERDPDAMVRFWIDQRVRGGPPAPRDVPSVDLMLRIVAAAPGAIGYIPASYVDDRVRVVARIVGDEVRLR